MKINSTEYLIVELGSLQGQFMFIFNTDQYQLGKCDYCLKQPIPLTSKCGCGDSAYCTIDC